MYWQCTKRPFAELGSARSTFMEQRPNGDGWSRGDKLEMLSLSAQVAKVLLVALCAYGLVQSEHGKSWVAALRSAQPPLLMGKRKLHLGSIFHNVSPRHHVIHDRPGFTYTAIVQLIDLPFLFLHIASRLFLACRRSKAHGC